MDYSYASSRHAALVVRFPILFDFLDFDRKVEFRVSEGVHGNQFVFCRVRNAEQFGMRERASLTEDIANLKHLSTRTSKYGATCGPEAFSDLNSPSSDHDPKLLRAFEHTKPRVAAK
jgi:hypothetical protein